MHGDPVAGLAGGWTFERKVRDRATGSIGTASGTARFVPVPTGLDWIETGTLLLDGHRFDAKRRMKIVRDSNGWQVRFEDGRLFHPIDLDRGRCEVGHPCGEDFYDGKLELTGIDREMAFTTEWKVKGPHKDQLIETVYRRA